jgi:hypothetical protein
MIAIMGSLTPLTPTIPSKQLSSGTCMTKNFYDVLSTTKITVLPTTSTSSRQPTPHQLIRERQQLPSVLTTSQDDQIPQRLQARH